MIDHLYPELGSRHHCCKQRKSGQSHIIQLDLVIHNPHQQQYNEVGMHKRGGEGDLLEERCVGGRALGPDGTAACHGVVHVLRAHGRPGTGKYFQTFWQQASICIAFQLESELYL